MYQDYKAAWAQLTAPGADFEVVTANVRGNDIRTYANAPGSLRDVWLSTAGFRRSRLFGLQRRAPYLRRNPSTGGVCCKLAHRTGRQAR